MSRSNNNNNNSRTIQKHYNRILQTFFVEQETRTTTRTTRTLEPTSTLPATTVASTTTTTTATTIQSTTVSSTTTSATNTTPTRRRRRRCTRRSTNLLVSSNLSSSTTTTTTSTSRGNHEKIVLLDSISIEQSEIRNTVWVTKLIKEIASLLVSNTTTSCCRYNAIKSVKINGYRSSIFFLRPLSTNITTTTTTTTNGTTKTDLLRPKQPTNQQPPDVTRRKYRNTAKLQLQQQQHQLQTQHVHNNNNNNHGYSPEYECDAIVQILSKFLLAFVPPTSTVTSTTTPFSRTPQSSPSPPTATSFRCLVQEVYFSNCDIGYKGIRSLGLALQQQYDIIHLSSSSLESSSLRLQILSFDNVRGMDDSDGRCSNTLATIIQHPNCTIRELYFRSTHLGPSSPSLVEVMTPYTPTTTTTTTNNSSAATNNNETTNTDDEDFHSHYQQQQHTTADEIILSWCIVLGKALRTNISITKLVLSNVTMNDNDCCIIVHYLQTQSTIQELDLSSNEITNVGATAIAQHLLSTPPKDPDAAFQDQQPQEQNQQSATSRNDPPDRDTVLRLQKLNLSKNYIGDSGMIAIAKSLRHNTNIHYLNVLHNIAISVVADDSNNNNDCTTTSSTTTTNNDRTKNVTTKNDTNTNMTIVRGGGFQAMMDMIQINTTIRSFGIDLWTTNTIAYKYLVESLQHNDTISSLLLDTAALSTTGAGRNYLSPMYLPDDDIITIILQNRNGTRVAPQKVLRKQSIFHWLLANTTSL